MSTRGLSISVSSKIILLSVVSVFPMFVVSTVLSFALLIYTELGKGPVKTLPVITIKVNSRYFILLQNVI